jgi:mono/diheme cytochrome c family protein
MKLLALLALLALAFPTHAASPRVCRIAASRVNRISAVSTLHTFNSHPQFVVTAFAVPVAVPVAPFAPYWYGVADYHYAPSLQGSASQPAAPEALPFASAREAEPRGSAFPGGAWERERRERSIIAQRCIACHGRTSPKQGLSLSDPHSLSAADRLRAIRAVVHGEMPPDTEPLLTAADREALVRELASP